MSEHHILVVEDDPDGQELVSRILRYHRVSFVVTPNGEEAYELLSQQSFSAAIIDLQLPGVDGWSLLKSIRRDGYALPCFAVTAYHSAEVAVKAIEAGFKAYFSKPLDATSFMRQLESYLV